MRSRLGPVLALPAVAALALGVLAGPAQAEESVVRDVTGDVVDAEGQPVAEGEAGEPAADIEWARLNFSEGRLRMAVKVRDITTTDRGISPNATWWLRTPGGGQYRVNRTATAGGGGYAEVWDLVAGDQVCQAWRGRSAKADTIRFVVSRDCLGDPEWVRFGASSDNGVRDADNRYLTRTDDVRTEGGPVDAPATFGPRVYAGQRG